jgi:hypothetical protein
MDSEEIVSTLMTLSETLCEKAMEINGSEAARDLVHRGKVLQKKTKKKSERVDEFKKKSDVVEISCCMMERGRTGYKKSSPMYIVELNKSDSYQSVISKVCLTIGEDVTNEMTLLNGKGAIIPNQCLNIRDKEVTWSLGAFLMKRHASPDKLCLGVGKINQTDEPKRKKAKINDDSKDVQIVVKEAVNVPPLEASNDDVVEVVYYALESNIIPCNREDIWNEINGAKGGLDKHEIFFPENVFYRVVSIIWIGKELNGRRSVLKTDSIGKITPFLTEGSPFCFTTCKNPVLTSKKIVPLVALSRFHPYCIYKWQCLSKSKFSNMEYPSSPVIYTNEPLMLKCSVYVKGSMEGSVCFDVSYVPITKEQHKDSTGCSIDDQIENNVSEDTVHSVQVQHEILSIPTPTFNSLEFFI